jgi:hypothetical protein
MIARIDPTPPIAGGLRKHLIRGVIGLPLNALNGLIAAALRVRRIALECRCTCIALPHLIHCAHPVPARPKIQPTVSAPTFDEWGSPICPATCRACWPPYTSATAHPQVEVIGHAVSFPQLNLKPVTQRLKVSIPLRVESHPTLIFVDTAVR